MEVRHHDLQSFLLCQLFPQSFDRKYVSQQRTAFKPIISLMPNGIKRDMSHRTWPLFSIRPSSWQSPPMSDGGGQQSLDHWYYTGHEVLLLPLARLFGTEQHKMWQSALLSHVVLLFGEGKAGRSSCSSSTVSCFTAWYRAVAFSTFDPSAVNVRASVLTHPLTSPAIDLGRWHITCTGCTICKIF